MSKLVDRWFGAAISVGLHLVLLLGATWIAVEHLGYFGDGGSGFACAVRETEVRLPLKEESRESLANRLTKPPPSSSEPLPSFGEFVAQETYSTDVLLAHVQGRPGVRRPPYLLYVEEGAILCASCLDSIWEEHDGNVLIVTIPRRVRVPLPLSGYAHRRRSLDENRADMPRLPGPGSANGYRPIYITASRKDLYR